MPCGLTIEKTQCELDRLTARVDELEGADPESLSDDNEVVYGAGTAYNLTDTAAAIDLGTTDPSITLGAAGTYLLFGSAQLEYAAATITTQTAALKLRRTNNTAADISDTPVTIDLPAATTLTHTVGIFGLPPVLYTTTNANDVISLFGNLSAAAGAGQVTVSDASIVAVRVA
jgi:hypothetical protein